ncbi:MAG: OmpW family outer membrane protein [Pseudomonadota bacterium]
MKRTLLMIAVLSGMTGVAHAEQGDWLVRLRGIIVAPTEETGPLLPAFPGSSVSVDNAIVPELDFTYFLTDRIAAELILATSPHDVSGTGDLAGLGEIIDTLVLPPTLTLQYHFRPNARLRPYAGVGVNYTIFYSTDAEQSLIDAIGPTAVDIDDSVGVAFQLGVDYDITDRFFVNADIKYIQVDTEAELNTGGAINTVDIDLDPIVAGIGFGVRF